MNIFKLISSTFRVNKRNKSRGIGFGMTIHLKNGNKEKTNPFTELEVQEVEELRIPELEREVRESFEALDYNLTYMDNKVANIALYLADEKELSKNKVFSIFERGIQICDVRPLNPYKLVKASEYYYKNYYSPEKQLKYNEMQSMCKKNMKN